MAPPRRRARVAPARTSALGAALMGCLVWAAAAPVTGALGYDVERRFCGNEAFHTDVSPPPVVLGCRVAGCCPGCDAAAPLDLAVDVEGDFPVSLEAGIEGDPALTAKLRPGRTVIKAVVAAASGSGSQAAPARPRLLRLQAAFDAAAVERAARVVPARRFNSEAAARLSVTFTQLQGDHVVAIDRFVATATSCPTQRPLTDRIELEGGQGHEEAVVIARAARDGVCVSGEIWTGKGVIYIGNWDSADGCPADLAVFARDRAAVLRSVGGLSPARSAASTEAARGAPSKPRAPPRLGVGQQVGPEGWTADVGERLEVSLASPRVVLPVVVRLIAAASEVEALRARSRFDLTVADRALDVSRCGIAVASGADTVVAPLEDTVRRDLLAAGEAPLAERCDRVDAALAQQGLRAPGRVEAIYVAEAALAVFTCREQGLVVLGGLAGPESLAHGLGHLLGLEHSQVAPAAPRGVADEVARGDFSLGSDNLMGPQGTARRSFTIGQCFVAFFDPHSVVNEWKLREGPIRSCGPGAVPDSCPPIGLTAGAQ